MFKPAQMGQAIPETGLWHKPGFMEGAGCATLIEDITLLTQRAPLRRMKTPYGSSMQVQMSNCGQVGWISDSDGYRYDRLDPMTGLPWPAMPESWQRIAGEAARLAGFPGFWPDVALINRYAPGTSLGLHQDKDESSFDHPIVSLSIGYRANFVMGGLRRNDRTRHIALGHGDALVFGGHSRLRYHGVAAVVDDGHPLGCRWNITFRKAC